MTPKQVVLALYKAYATRDADEIARWLDDDVVWVAPAGNATQVALGLGEAGDAGPPRGANDLDKAAIIDFMTRDFGRLFGDVRNDIHTIVDAGDHVVVESRLSAALAHGRPYLNDYCFVYRVAGQRVAAIREYMDSRGAWVQMFGDAPGGPLVAPR